MSRRTRDQSLDFTLVALADPTRRAILRRLAKEQARVTDVAKAFPISLNSVSKHIKLLERSGLVKRQRIGREHFLRFSPKPLQKVRDWIAGQEAFWKAGMEALDALLNDENKHKEPGDGDKS